MKSEKVFLAGLISSLFIFFSASHSSTADKLPALKLQLITDKIHDPVAMAIPGDVGQNKYEEVDISHKGGNYGWRVMDGYHVYNMSPGGADTANMIKPITEYDHKTTGISVIGGYVYRGKAIPALEGKYVFGDYNGKTFYLEQNANGSWTRHKLVFKNEPDHFQIYSFGQDAKGELYVLGAVALGNGFNGMVYELKN